MKEKRRGVGKKLLVPTRRGANYLRKRRVVPVPRLTWYGWQCASCSHLWFLVTRSRTKGSHPTTVKSYWHNLPSNIDPYYASTWGIQNCGLFCNYCSFRNYQHLHLVISPSHCTFAAAAVLLYRFLAWPLKASMTVNPLSLLGKKIIDML